MDVSAINPLVHLSLRWGDCLAQGQALMAWFEPNQLGWLGVLVISLTFVMYITRKRIQASRTSSAPSILERYRAAGAEFPTSSRREIEEAILELDRVARHIHGQLDTRMARLEGLLRAADAQIDRLTRLTRDSETGSALDVTLDVALDPQTERTTAAPPTMKQPAVPDGHTEVHRLADEGADAAAIAQRLDRPEGEIALILALRRARETAVAGSP